MVLLAGDLFHDNKPSRQTLYKAMTILRRNTMGPNPVKFQISSNQAENFRSAICNTVNYEDPYSCVDLPIFSIHGNHDDPTRDGGTDMLAALDLLAVNHLVNYFGRHDKVDQVQVSPVLIKKGGTKVALYGMGSMRDERLNRMWQGKKVKFLKANRVNGNGSGDRSDDDEDSDKDDGSTGWFNIFALHQNRDLGRGAKNCVQESMIPEFMDLVVWGHEHECLINPSESAVGTFRIIQPGSSVATSLTEGESMRKHVGILDIRGSQFRMVAVPLMNVRSFAMGQVILSEKNLDPEDPRIDEAIKELLTAEVEKLTEQAREDSRLLQKDAQAASNGDIDLKEHRHYRVEKPDQVLVRLKVEHSGFSTLHNQRFGSQFIKDVVSIIDRFFLCHTFNLRLAILILSHNFFLDKKMNRQILQIFSFSIVGVPQPLLRAKRRGANPNLIKDSLNPFLPRIWMKSTLKILSKRPLAPPTKNYKFSTSRDCL